MAISNQVERVALAIEATMFAPHELPVDDELHSKYLGTAQAAIDASGAPDLLSALKAIRDFCDDPNGSEKPESLAMGLSRLLPAARAAIAKAGAQS
jgi:hypothetical protein